MASLRTKVKPCDEHCHCRACNEEYAEHFAAERERDELAHRDRIIREHTFATDREWRAYLDKWAWGFGDEPETIYDAELNREGVARG
jgi:hypothetical protein